MSLCNWKTGQHSSGMFSSNVCIRHWRTKSMICSRCGEAPDVKLLASSAGRARPPACAAVGHLVPCFPHLLLPYLLCSLCIYQLPILRCLLYFPSCHYAHGKEHNGPANRTIAWPLTADGLLVFLDWPPCLVPLGRRSSTFLGL